MKRLARRRRDERGIAALEFAMVALFLFGLTAAAFDLGMAWRSGLTMNEAVRTGARVGAGQARSSGADLHALTGLRASLVASGKIADVDRVIIFRATNSDGEPPASCLVASPSSGGSCVILSGTQLENVGPGNFNYVPPPNPTDQPTGTGCMISGYMQRTTSWCPTQRNNSITSNGQYIGYHIVYKHQYLFQLLGQEQVISRTAVMRLEPEPI